MGSTTRTIETPRIQKLRGLVARYFYLFMSVLIAAIVVYGFSHTVNRFLIHAVPVRPWILYLHATVFSGWIIFFILQSTLVRVRQVKVHRTLGWFGAALATAMVVIGLSTAYTMDRFNILHFHETRQSPFLAIQLQDMGSFAILFALAVLWRKKPEWHRRFVLMASCTLMSAAFARFPAIPLHLVYHCVEALIFLGVLRDLFVNRRIHAAYLYVLPTLIVTHAIALHLYFTAPARWVRITDAILRLHS